MPGQEHPEPEETAVPRTAPTTRRIPIVAAAAALLLTGCGGSGEDTDDAAASSSAPASSSAAPSSSAEAPAESPAEAGGTITVTGVDFEYEMDSTDLAAGDYEIEFVNDGGASHDVRVELDGEDVAMSEVIPPGETSTFTVTLEPGEYVFYCSVGNHRGMGMEVR
jgi:plastocyanin